MPSPSAVRSYTVLLMLKEVPTADLDRLRPLFANLPGLHGCAHAALEGTMGSVVADSVEQPTMALIDLDFYFLGGDPGSPAAERARRYMPGGDARSASAERAVSDFELPASVIASASWEPLLQRVWGDALLTRTRVAFSPGDWDRRRLRAFSDALPNGMSVRRIAARDARSFEDLAESLVYNFDSLDDFVERGVGFGIEHAGRFVSGCSSFAISSHSLEFEIQTHPDFQRRGFASATAAAMIEHCLDHGLEPCWDAHNSMSAALATKLGFVDPTPYTAYELPPDAQPL